MIPAIRLAIDVESGDHGYREIILGVLAALEKLSDNIVCYLCGKKSVILSIFRELGIEESRHKKTFIIEHCPDSVEPEDVPSRVWKQKAGSPIIRCITLQRDGIVDASVSAGDTGILMSAAMFLLGRCDGNPRPALAALLPTIGSLPTLLLDVGANLSCRADHLISFATMGYSYYQENFSIPNPQVALLNIGREPEKGTASIRAAADALALSCRGFSGFCEGTDILSGTHHVIVCDGFTGNALLKTCESFHTLIETVCAPKKELFASINEMLTILNSENYGAVPFLGINGVVLKAHGRSNEKAIARAVRTAAAAGAHAKPFVYAVR